MHAIETYVKCCFFFTFHCTKFCTESKINFIKLYSKYTVGWYWMQLVRTLREKKQWEKNETIVNQDDCFSDFLEGQRIALILVDRENYSLSNCVFGFLKKEASNDTKRHQRSDCSGLFMVYLLLLSQCHFLKKIRKPNSIEKNFLFLMILTSSIIV